MKRFNSQVTSPALLTVFVAVAGIMGLQSGSQAPVKAYTARATSVQPDVRLSTLTGDVPFIGEMSVTASRN